MGSVTFFAAIMLQSSLSQQMGELRQQLNHVSLERHNIEAALQQQEVFIQELQSEEARVRPQVQQNRDRLAGWLAHLRPVTSPASTRLLPPPVFDFHARNRQSFAEAMRDDLSRSYAELMSLEKHWQETERQLVAAQVEIQTKTRYLNDLSESLKSTLAQKETFLKRLGRNPGLIEKIKEDYRLARLHLDEGALMLTPAQPRAASNTMFRNEEGELLKVRLPVHGEVYRAFGRTVHPRYQTVTDSKGVYLETLSGQEVQVVLPGDVVFVGNYGLFGQLVMVRHSGGISTLYSGFSQVFVEKGQHLRYRQPLGLSGHGFGLEYEGVYFEVRAGRTAVNPLHWMRRLNKANGQTAAVSASQETLEH